MAEQITARIGLDSTEFQRGIRSVEMQMGSLAASVAGAFTATALVSYGKHLLDTADKVQDLASAFGLSVETIQRLDGAARQTGASLDTFAKSLRSLVIAQADALGGGGKLDAFAALGVSIDELRDKSPEELLARIADGYVQMKGSAEAFAATNELLGKNALEIMPLLERGAQGVRDAMSAGAVATQEEIDKLADTKAKIAGFFHEIEVPAMKFGGAVIDVFRSLNGVVSTTATGFQGLWKLLKGDVDGFTAAMADARGEAQRVADIVTGNEQPAEKAKRIVGGDAADAKKITGGVGSELMDSLKDVGKLITDSLKEARDALKEQQRATEEVLRIEEQIARIKGETSLVGATTQQRLDAAKAELENAPIPDIQKEGVLANKEMLELTLRRAQIEQRIAQLQHQVNQEEDEKRRDANVKAAMDARERDKEEFQRNMEASRVKQELPSMRDQDTSAGMFVRAGMMGTTNTLQQSARTTAENTGGIKTHLGNIYKHLTDPSAGSILVGAKAL